MSLFTDNGGGRWFRVVITGLLGGWKGSLFVGGGYQSCVLSLSLNLVIDIP